MLEAIPTFRGKNFVIVPASTLVTPIETISLLPFGDLCIAHCGAHFSGYDPTDPTGLFFSGGTLSSYQLNGSSINDISAGQSFGSDTAGANPAVGAFDSLDTDVRVAVVNLNATQEQHVLINWSIIVVPFSELKALT